MTDGDGQSATGDAGGSAPEPAIATRPEAPSDAEKTPKRGGAMAFGILLVLLGVALTAGRFIPGLNVLNAWPLIIVSLGGVRVFRSPDAYGIVDGMTTVLVGGLLLMNTLGRLSWGVWLNVFSLWPLLLVAAGIAIVGRATSLSWLKVFAQLVIVAGLLYGALVIPAGSWRFPMVVTSLGSGAMAPFRQSLPTDNAPASRGTAMVRWGAADVTVKDGSYLASASGTAPRSSPPRLSHDVVDGLTAVTLDAAGGGGAGPGGRLDVKLGRDTRWEDIVLQLGATSAEIDLRELEVDSLRLDTGASSGRITIGDKARAVSVRVNAGVASVVLRVPKGASVAVRTTGLVAATVPGDFSGTGGGLLNGSWTRSPKNARTSIDIVVSGGLTALEVETY